MVTSFRFKLLAIVAIAGIGLGVMVVAGTLVERSTQRHLDEIRENYIPKIGLGVQLTSGFEHVRRQLQDAAQAADTEALDEAHRQELALLEQLDHAAIPATDVATVRSAITDYYQTADALTRRLIAGESGEALVHELELMQTKQTFASEKIATATHFDENGLTEAFAATASGQETGSRVRLIISAACVALVLGLSIWLSRGLYRSLFDLAAGFRRFGSGDFATEIPASRPDELGSVARDANEMAARLRALAEQRDRTDWVKAGQVGLADELRGDLELADVGQRALRFLAHYLDAPIAILYSVDGDARLRPLGSIGVIEAPTATFAIGEGLIGDAATRTELTVLAAPRGHLPIRSGLIDGDPHTIVFAPLVHGGKITGVIELGVLGEWPAAAGELVAALNESIAISIEVARGRAAARELLAETQRQATELLDARRGLEQKADELARASSYKSQFLANMSHELRTPLNAILGFSELMYDGAVPPDSSEHKEFLGDILRSGRHLLQLINDVLDLSKVEAGKLEFHPEHVTLSVTIEEVLGILRTTAATARVKIEPKIESAVDALEIDPARLKQILYNFISNAIKFTPEGGRITIRGTAEGSDRIRIEVEDTGIGISPEGLQRLFGEFQQVSTDGKKRGGTGLGLALTKRLVEAQGGTIGVSSVVGKGTVFHAVLPRKARVTPATDVTPFAVGTPGAPSVLVIEDNARDQRDLVDALAAAGYTVEVTSSGADALARCAERRFDAITLDLLLPDMSGLEVLRGIRTSEKNSAVPVVVITVVAERGAVAGFAVDDILSKPVDPDALLKALARANVEHHTGRVLVVDDDAGALRLMAATLDRLGYPSVCEQDGAAALRTVRTAPPVAIVLDLLMPGMSGFEFLDQLRREPAGRKIPVIVWTSKDLSTEERSRLRASANAVVAKGVNSSSAVLAEIAAVVAPPRTG